MIDVAEFQDRSIEKSQRVASINRSFKEGQDALDISESLKAIEKPILVDFNNVLFNNRSPYVPNPEAGTFLHELQSIGDVIIATTSRDWDGVQGLLQRAGMWSDNIVLMTASNYESTRLNEELLNEFLQKRDLPVIGKRFYDISPGGKPLSPLFDKSFDIPLLDDDSVAEHPFPGLLGVKIRPFFATEEEGAFRGDQERGKSLSEAVEIVRNHYSTISK